MPALLSFVAIYTMVHLKAHGLGLAAKADDDGDTVLGILCSRGYLRLSLVVMIWLLWQGYTPTAAGFWAVISLAGLIVMFDPGARRRYLPVVVEARDHAPRLIAPITVAWPPTFPSRSSRVATPLERGYRDPAGQRRLDHRAHRARACRRPVAAAAAADRCGACSRGCPCASRPRVR
jgi:hypothetical protein